MDASWQVVLQICYLFLFMIIAKLIKEKLGIFKSIVIPTALLGGFIGLIFGPDLLGRINFSLFGEPMSLGLNYEQDFYSNIIFYFMIIGFVSLTLTERQIKQNRKSIDSGFFIVSIYMLQALLGIATLYVLIATIRPDVIAGLGLFLPLGFASGPGLASSIGQSWDTQLPYGWVQQYGITLASTGFIVGGIVGVILLNYYIRKYNLKPIRLRDLDGIKTKSVDFSTLREFNFSDNLLVQVSWIGFIILITFLISLGINKSLTPLGTIGESLSSTIIGFSYLFGIFIAMALRGYLRWLEARGHRTKQLIDNYMMHNISSFALNVMITASVMSIKIASIKEFYEILIAISVVGTIGTLIFVTKFGRYIYKENTNEYILAMFGMQTGVAATGVALLRGLDPELETDTSDNVIVLGSAFAAPWALPIIIVLSFPLLAYNGEGTKILGINIYDLLTPLSIFVYFIILVFILVFRAKRRNRKLNK